MADAKGMAMNKGALALLVHGGSENWSPRRWKSRFDEVCEDRRVLLLPDASFDPAEVHYAAVWKPQPGDLAAFPADRHKAVKEKGVSHVQPHTPTSSPASYPAPSAAKQHGFVQISIGKAHLHAL